MKMHCSTSICKLLYVNLLNTTIQYCVYEHRYLYACVYSTVPACTVILSYSTCILQVQYAYCRLITFNIPVLYVDVNENVQVLNTVCIVPVQYFILLYYIILVYTGTVLTPSTTCTHIQYRFL